MRLIDFIPPIIGIEGKFNTFRLGLFYSKCLKPGEVVGLVDSKARLLIGTANVIEVHLGTVQNMTRAWAHENHTQLKNVSDVPVHERLYEVMLRIYGPHILTPTKKVTVVRLERRHGGQKANL